MPLRSLHRHSVARTPSIRVIATLQVEYSPLALDIKLEKLGLFKTAQELCIAIVACSPLGRSLLSGSFERTPALLAHRERPLIDGSLFFSRTLVQRTTESVSDGRCAMHIPLLTADNFPELIKLVDGFATTGAKHCVTSVVVAWLFPKVFAVHSTNKVKAPDPSSLSCFYPPLWNALRSCCGFGIAPRGQRGRGVAHLCQLAEDPRDHCRTRRAVPRRVQRPVLPRYPSR